MNTKNIVIDQSKYILKLEKEYLQYVLGLRELSKEQRKQLKNLDSVKRALRDIIGELTPEEKDKFFIGILDGFDKIDTVFKNSLRDRLFLSLKAAEDKGAK